MIVFTLFIYLLYLLPMVTNASLPSEGPLVGHPAGHPDSVHTDGLHRPPMWPHAGNLGPGVTLERIGYTRILEYEQRGGDTADGRTDGRQTAGDEQREGLTAPDFSRSH